MAEIHDIQDLYEISFLRGELQKIRDQFDRLTYWDRTVDYAEVVESLITAGKLLQTEYQRQWLEIIRLQLEIDALKEEKQREKQIIHTYPIAGDLDGSWGGHFPR